MFALDQPWVYSQHWILSNFRYGGAAFASRDYRQQQHYRPGGGGGAPNYGGYNNYGGGNRYGGNVGGGHSQDWWNWKTPGIYKVLVFEFMPFFRSVVAIFKKLVFIS